MNERIDIYVFDANRGRWEYLCATRMHATLASARRAYESAHPAHRFDARWSERA